MLTAFGFSRSAGAAAGLARARAAGIGGRSGLGIFSFGGVRKLGDEMFAAFCLVCERPEQGENQKRQTGQPHDKLLRDLARNPWMLQRYPWLQDRYPWMFAQTRLNNGYTHTLH